MQSQAHSDPGHVSWLGDEDDGMRKLMQYFSLHEQPLVGNLDSRPYDPHNLGLSIWNYPEGKAW